MTTATIAITHVPRTDLATVRIRTAMAGLPAAMGEAFGTLYGLLGRRGIAPTGPPLAIYDAIGEEAVRARIAVPVGAPIDPEGEVLAEELPEGDVATVEHVGPYERLGRAYERLDRWLDEHGYEKVGPHRERYLNGPDEVGPDELRTLIDVPVRERRA